MIDLNELRESAKSAGYITRLSGQGWYSQDDLKNYLDDDLGFDAKFIAAVNPAAISELLDRLEAAEKERDALRATVERMDAALESLLIRCDDSDSAMYGTLSTSFVRDTVRIARDTLEESK